MSCIRGLIRLKSTQTLKNRVFGLRNKPVFSKNRLFAATNSFLMGFSESPYINTVAYVPDEVADMLSRHTIFTVMRNPYDWMASIYIEFYKNEISAFASDQTSALDVFLDHLENGKVEGPASCIQTQYFEGVTHDRLEIIAFDNIEPELFAILGIMEEKQMVRERVLDRGEKKKLALEEVKNYPRFIEVCDKYLEKDFEFLRACKPELLKSVA